MAEVVEVALVADPVALTREEAWSNIAGSLGYDMLHQEGNRKYKTGELKLPMRTDQESWIWKALSHQQPANCEERLRAISTNVEGILTVDDAVSI